MQEPVCQMVFIAAVRGAEVSKAPPALDGVGP